MAEEKDVDGAAEGQTEDVAAESEKDSQPAGLTEEHVEIY